MKVKALERVRNSLRIIDQTRLPEELAYKDLASYRDVITAIKRLEIRGAPAIGIAAAYGLAIAQHSLEAFSPDRLKQVGEEIKSSRPTAVNLAWAIDRVMRRVTAAAPATRDEALGVLWEEATAIHEEDRLMCRRIGEHGAELIEDGDAILTHCNTGALATGGIGTALGVIYTCRDQGKSVRVFADETRPLLQGARLTAWELNQEGINVTLICDNCVAFLMAQGRIGHVIVGADRIARNGDSANKIGTYGLALLARDHDIPFCVAAPSSTFDESIESCDEIIIEERSSQEVSEGFGRRTAPAGISVYSPAFDITPSELISYFITDRGVRPGGRSV